MMAEYTLHTKTHPLANTIILFYTVYSPPSKLFCYFHKSLLFCGVLLPCVSHCLTYCQLHQRHLCIHLFCFE